MTWLLLYALLLSLYDLRTRRIPNWATFPLVVAGFIAHFPGYPDIWFASIGLFLAWANGWMGSGDAKLWIALLWALPVNISAQVLPLIFLTFLLTGLLQLAWRWIHKQPIPDILTPGAWRTIPFLLLCWYVH
ncbi:MAG: A24 family peptidase [Anaerolineales bacterium]|nr:MAG: A24 family peptidase [Anaerolineales bacterium]